MIFKKCFFWRVSILIFLAGSRISVTTKPRRGKCTSPAILMNKITRTQKVNTLTVIAIISILASFFDAPEMQKISKTLDFAQVVAAWLLLEEKSKKDESNSGSPKDK